MVARDGGFPPQSRVNARCASPRPAVPGSPMSIIFLAAAALAIGQPVESQPLVQPETRLAYADLADLALAAPVVAHLRIRDSDALRPEEAPNLRPGYRRFLIEAEVVALIRGEGGLPERVSYLVDLPTDSRGRAVRPRRRDEVLVLARRVATRAGELRLVAPDAQ